MAGPTAARILGTHGETLALRHYERLGYTLVERNWTTAAGEIDLILADRSTLVFAEVKTRRVGGLDPIVALTWEKRRRLRRLAARWLAETRRPSRSTETRIDAVAVVVDADGRLVALDHYEDVA